MSSLNFPVVMPGCCNSPSQNNSLGSHARILCPCAETRVLGLRVDGRAIRIRYLPGNLVLLSPLSREPERSPISASRNESQTQKNGTAGIDDRFVTPFRNSQHFHLTSQMDSRELSHYST